ncbi:MAG: universal stress protein [Candidatus Bathyarchaeia archaeon]
MLERLLVPVDGSEHAEEAMFFALDLAERFGSEVGVLNVLPNVGIRFASSPMWVGEHLERMRGESREMLGNHFEKAVGRNPDLEITTELKEGRPADVIVETVEEEDYSMIVMGSRGLGVVQEMVLGSVSREVVEKSRIPVLIVK